MSSEFPRPDGDRFRCGTLVYTRAGLFTLFAWLLWGDFCFSLMEAIWPSIVPLMLKAEGTPNVLISVVITTIPSAMNFLLNPIISTASDRYRGRHGRRIPFLRFATPFITLFLILLGFSRQLGSMLHGLLVKAMPDLAPAAVTIGLICVLIIGFRFFELFVNTVFWYLFNDVVPPAFIGRFVGFFRLVGLLAGAIFNFFIFRYAEAHAHVIFLCVALLYGTAFFLMCRNVREGSYPPPDRSLSENKSPLHLFRTFFRECFSHRIFRRVFAYNALLLFGAAANVFNVFMAFSIGLDLDRFGKVAGVSAFVGALLMYPMGALVDRFHPLRVMLVAKAAFCLVASINLVFLFYDFPPDIAFWIYACSAAIAIPVTVANTAASLPMVMKLFPHERFGQFCSANAMCGALGMMAGGLCAGLFLDAMRALFPGGDYYYRFVPAWTVLFTALALLAAFLVFRDWKRLGGDKAYQPPSGDSFKDFYKPE